MKRHLGLGAVFAAFLIVGVAGCGGDAGGSATPGGDSAKQGSSDGSAGVGARPMSPRSGAEVGAAIHDVQGRGTRSPLEGQCVQGVEGVVTAREAWGFVMEAPSALWDDDEGTSEALFVYTQVAPAVALGDLVEVDGCVSEHVPGGAGSGNLSTTELVGPTVRTRARGVALPPAVVLGRAGRPVPGDVAEALRFYESLEAMQVRVDGAVIVGPAAAHGRLPVVGDGGDEAGPRTLAGGVHVAPGDVNGERILLAVDRAVGGPRLLATARTGDRLPEAVQGVLGYRFGAYELRVQSALPEAVHAGPGREGPTELAGDKTHVTVATFNAENLSPTDPAHVREVAQVIATTLGGPDVVALQEVQDGNGAARGELSADATLRALVQSVQEAGGPPYAYVDIPPATEGADGGAPGANIRVALLWRPDRIAFEARGTPSATTEAAVASSGGHAHPVTNPVRIDPGNPAFAHSRKPLVAELSFEGTPMFVVLLHLVSKRGDAPLFGAQQPPPAPSASQRLAQARVVTGFVQTILEADPKARVVVLGDLNDYAFSAPVRALEQGSLTNLVDQLPVADPYTYVYEGNAQVLDHLLVSPTLTAGAEADVVHVDADFPPTERASDHDPVIARLAISP